TLLVTTDSEGQAKASGLKLNQTNGKLPIHVTASYRGLSARAIITQFNEGGVAQATSAGGGGHGALIGVLVAVGAAAAGGGAGRTLPRTRASSLLLPPQWCLRVRLRSASLPAPGRLRGAGNYSCVVFSLFRVLPSARWRSRVWLACPRWDMRRTRAPIRFAR